MPRTRFSPSDAKVSCKSSGLVNTQFDGAIAFTICVSIEPRLVPGVRIEIFDRIDQGVCPA